MHSYVEFSAEFRNPSLTKIRWRVLLENEVKVGNHLFFGGWILPLSDSGIMPLFTE